MLVCSSFNSIPFNRFNSRLALLWRKLPMAWGVPQQTEKPQKSIPSQYAREIKHLTLKDLETYLILDG